MPLIDQTPVPDGLHAAASDETRPAYRSGAVARMIRMPVATLRIWERRYQVAAPVTSATGHRLYSAADVQRLALVKQLTELGHSIGSIAGLDVERLRQVAATHATTLAGSRVLPAPGPQLPWRVVVVGAALLRRLQRPTLQRRLGRPLEIVASVAQVDQLAALSVPSVGLQADVLLVHVSGLHEGDLADLQAAARAIGAPRLAVFYGFASAAIGEAFAGAGVALLREPRDDAALGSWLKGLGETTAPMSARSTEPIDRTAPVTDPMLAALGPVPPRRYNDATLADFAGLSSTIACECPRHLAELLMQLSHFEAYSAQCRNRSPADAELHAYLGQVAGASRSLFESALERVAVLEGLMVPPP
jgi:DNA-binding transcriptional MerR regulator